MKHPFGIYMLEPYPPDKPNGGQGLGAYEFVGTRQLLVERGEDPEF